MVDGSWPALEYEDVDWTPRAQYAGRSLATIINRSYRAAVPPAIAPLPVDLSSQTRAIAADATAALAAFDAEIGTGFAPFEALLLRSESAASSQIENLTASAKAVLMAEAGDDNRQNAALIAANSRAMRAAIDLAEEPTVDSVIEMHRALIEPSDSTIVGHWRDQPVWIGGSSMSPHGATFVPPRHERVPAAMNDLMTFAQRTDLPPFEQAMIAHAQFETIHPFPDGNGRTGRALIHSMLHTARITLHTTVPISAGLLADTGRYFDALTAYREGDPERLIRLASEASFRAIENGRRLAADMATITARWEAALEGLRTDALARRIVADLPTTPLLDVSMVRERYGVSQPVANNAIATLEAREVMSRANAGLRNRRWIAHDVAAALDAFAERSQRRR